MGESVEHTLRGISLLITGGNTGIGHALARHALAAGADVHVTCRSEAKARATVATLAADFPSSSVGASVADMADLASVARLADQLLSADVRFDTLILNAGIHLPFGRHETTDGHELHRQVNFLAPAYLFRRLAAQRTVQRGAAYISSDAHHRGHLPAIFPVSFWARYAHSKLLATTFFLAARPLFPDLTLSVLSPGNVDSDVHRYKHPWVRAVRGLTGAGRSTDEAAAGLLDTLFGSGEPERYSNRGRPEAPARRCLDPKRMLAVWTEVDEVLVSHPSCAASRPSESRAAEIVKNHAGNIVSLAPRVRRPGTAAEVSDLVQDARRCGRTVRVVGSRHSYNDCFYSHSELIDLSRFDQVREIDRERSTITVGGGVTVQALADHLDAQGYTLRWAGNSGAQTFVGAAMTGTHGYSRDGGLLAELIVGVQMVTGSGEIVHISDEEELRAIRVSLGTLGVVVEVTIQIERTRGLVEYALETVDEAPFLAQLSAAVRSNTYFRFFPNRFHPERISVLTINPTTTVPDSRTLARVRYIGLARPPRIAVAFVRSILRSRTVRAFAPALPAPRLSMSIIAPFSSLMFVNGGIVDRWYGVVGLVYHAWDNDETRNMELAIRPEDFQLFLSTYRAVEQDFRTGNRKTGLAGRRIDCYFTGRYVGASHRTLLGANHNRDVIFVDVHATQCPEGSAFLEELERRLASVIDTRPHWGKEFQASRCDLRRAYPAPTWQAFDAAKCRYDPHNIFSNRYTERVFGW